MAVITKVVNMPMHEMASLMLSQNLGRSVLCTKSGKIEIKLDEPIDGKDSIEVGTWKMRRDNWGVLAAMAEEAKDFIPELSVA